MKADQKHGCQALSALCPLPSALLPSAFILHPSSFILSAMIRLDRLSKSFRGKPALEPLSLEIGQGEVFGLLGHNGAGKSTTFGLLLGHLHPSGGEAFVRGVSVQRDRSRALQRVGAIFETPAFYDYLSGWRNLQIITAYSSRVTRAEIEETIRFVGLEKTHP